MAKAQMTDAVTETGTEALEGAALSLRVFMVENHADTREFLTFMLEELGHHVIVADTMTKALREVPLSDSDVLISDIGLPDGDGWELLSRLNLPHPIFAIAMSGFGTASDRARSKAAGFRHHLVKPMGLEQLETILNDAAEELRGANERRARRSP
ncbi:MAG: response regulator [Burkholderiaceae bacterium]